MLSVLHHELLKQRAFSHAGSIDDNEVVPAICAPDAKPLPLVAEVGFGKDSQGVIISVENGVGRQTLLEITFRR